MREIQGIVIHCSATPPNMDIGANEIDRWHRKRGWRCIGYHNVIRRGGTIQSGRPIAQAGAHVKGHNKHTIGICMVGGVDHDNNAENNFTPEQWASLKRLVMDMMEPHMYIKGHRDFPNVHKDCPSFDVSEWMANALNTKESEHVPTDS